MLPSGDHGTVALKECLERITKSLETAEWVTCPLCRQEWTKLKPCSYFEGGRTVVTYVCVLCGESVQSIAAVFGMMRIDAAIYPFERKKPYDDLARSHGDYFDSPRIFKVRVENAAPVVNVIIESAQTHMVLNHLEGKTTMRFDNIFQCGSYFKHLIETAKAPAPKETKEWGS